MADMGRLLFNPLPQPSQKRTRLAQHPLKVMAPSYGCFSKNRLPKHGAPWYLEASQKPAVCTKYTAQGNGDMKGLDSDPGSQNMRQARPRSKEGAATHGDGRTKTSIWFRPLEKVANIQ